MPGVLDHQKNRDSVTSDHLIRYTACTSFNQCHILFTGCQCLRIIDGCWKICAPHCMMAVPNEVKGYPLLNFPNVCTAEPAANSVFCKSHLTLLRDNNIPTEKKAFLRHLKCPGKNSIALKLANKEWKK